MSKRVEQGLLIGILLSAAWLRFYHLDGSSLWSDEGNTWALLTRSFAQIARDAAADIHPPGYYWLLKLWTGMLGNTAWGMRSFSALAGVMLVYLTHKLANQIAISPHPINNSPLTIDNLQFFPLLAALLAALNPFQIYYSQEARMYMLLALESAGLFWAVLLWGRVARWPVLLFGLCASAGLWTQYSFPVILAAANLAVLWATIKSLSWKDLKPLFFANLFALLTFLPWLPTAIDQVRNWPKGGVNPPLLEAASLTVQTLLFGPLRDLPEPLWPWLVGAAILPVLGLLALRRSQLGVALALWLLAPIALLLGLGLFSPAFLKFLLVASPAWCIAVAAVPINWLTVQHATRNTQYVLRVAYCVIGVLGATLALVTLPGYYTDPAVRDNYAGVAHYIGALGDPQRDLVLLNAPGQQEVWRYYDPEVPVLALPQQRPPDPAQTIAELAAAVEDRRQVFALFWATDEADPNGLVEHWLDQNAFKGMESWQGNLRFVTYSLATRLSCQPFASPAGFGAQIFLTAQCQPALPQSVAAGDVALIGLRWQASELINQTYKITVQLLDERNQVIAQHDGEPAGGTQPTTAWAAGAMVEDNHGLAIPLGTPPGAYRLVVAVYDSSNGQRLTVAEGDALDLGTIQVTRPQRPLPVDILPILQRVGQQMGPVMLVGYDAYRKDAAHAPATPLVAGDFVHFTLYWQAPTPLAPNWPTDLAFTLQLGDQWMEAPLAGGRYPTGQWQPGELVRGEFDLLFDGQSRAAELVVDGNSLQLTVP